MMRRQVRAASVNCAIVALRFFFKVMFKRAYLVQRLPFVHEPRKTPIVLSQKEVARLLEASLAKIQSRAPNSVMRWSVRTRAMSEFG